MEKQVVGKILAGKQEGFEGQRACILPRNKKSFCAKHPFCKNLYITDIGYYPEAASHDRIRSSGSAEYILIHCVKGKGWYRIQNKRFEVQAHQYFIIPANSSHQYGADVKEPWSIYWAHFTGDLAPFYSKLLTSKKALKPGNAVVNTTRQLLFYDIIQHLELMNNPENIVYAIGCFYAYLSSFQPSEMKVAGNENEIIERGMEYMKSHLHENLRLNELCAAMKISPAHLSALFRKKTKYSPIHLFTSLRMQKACQMLMDNSQNIKAISYNLGYADQYHFSRVFKTIMGVAPKNFRQAERD